MPKYKKYLNPIFNDIDRIQDFSEVKKDTPLLKDEYPYLENTTKVLTKEIKIQNKKLETINKQLEALIKEIESFTGDDKSDSISTYNNVFGDLEESLERINRNLNILNTPYFGKIIFENKENKKNTTSYIGKFSFFDKENNTLLITDWRAPIANLYYQNSGPTNNTSFVGPKGEQKGNLNQKRQFEISYARITSIYDSKTGNIAADEFLISQLKKRIGSKLSDIVSTIQEQQNKIIREEINKPIIVQGVAGSGKTTILLHKIAYILFTYQKDIDPKQSIIIAPNKLFLDYISDVLPNLGIQEIEYNTFLFWAKKILNWDEKHIISDKKNNIDIKEYKGSLKFKEEIEKNFDKFENMFLDKIPNTLKYDLSEKYFEVKEKYPQIAMIERLELSLNYAVTQRQFRQNLKSGYIAPIKNMDNKEKEVQAYIKKQCNVWSIYKNILGKIKHENKKLQESVYSERGILYYQIEDLPPILWIYFQLYSSKEHMKDYILVDEAQDMSLYQIFILKEVARKENITLAGDLAQSIIPPFHIKNWDDVKNLFNTKPSFHELHRCYRTTIEIINFINKILIKNFPEKIKSPEAVLRHGEEVEYINGDIKEIIEIINKEFKKDISNLAVICKDLNHANEIYDKLNKHKNKIGREILSHKDDNYDSGLLILPIEKTKGLEFDTVIIAEMTDKYYKKDFLDMKLLYVAVTRALHKLYIHVPKNEKESFLLKD